MTTIEEKTSTSCQDQSTQQDSGGVGGSGFRQLAALFAGSLASLPTGLRRGDGAALLVIVAALFVIITFVSISARSDTP